MQMIRDVHLGQSYTTRFYELETVLWGLMLDAIKKCSYVAAFWSQ